MTARSRRRAPAHRELDAHREAAEPRRHPLDASTVRLDHVAADRETEATAVRLVRDVGLKGLREDTVGKSGAVVFDFEDDVVKYVVLMTDARFLCTL